MLIEKTEFTTKLLDEMRSTGGWKLFENMLHTKYKIEVRALIANSEDIAETASRRARCKLLGELIMEAGVNKEERWTI